MVRNVKTGELFATFKYDGYDCADMGIYNVTNGSVYTMNIEPNFSDNKLEVPAYDGRYYYGTQITGQQFQFNCFCHDLLSTEYNRLRAWLNPRKIGRLILSDQPYKYYLVKPISVSTLGAYPLTTIQTPQNSVLGDYVDGDVVYTGNFTVTFETVGSAYGYGMSYYRDDLIYDAKKKYGRDYYYNSGLLYKDMSPRVKWDIPANALNYEFNMYNPGSAYGQPIFMIENSGTFTKNSYIKIDNESMGTSTIIDIGNISGDITIDTSSQTITDTNGNSYYGRFNGNAFRLNPFESVIELPETFVENIEDTDLQEYDSFYIENNIVYMNPKVLEVSEDLKERYFCVNFNGGSKIIDVDIDNNTLTLDSVVLTYDIPKAQVDGGVLIKPAGFAFNYIEVNGVKPSTGELGDVCFAEDKWWIYLYNEWKETNYFSSVDDFKNIYGDYITQYKMFGATIVKLDKLTMTTGTNISYKENNTIKTGASMDAIKLVGELRPRYL